MLPNQFPPGDDRRLHLPQSVGDQRFARSFTEMQRGDLTRLNVKPRQLDRLQVALRVIAWCTEAPPPLADVRKTLASVAEHASAAVRALNSLLSAPTHETARDEAKLRFLEAIEAIYPDRCRPDAQKIHFFHRYDPRMDEAERLRNVVAGIEHIALHAQKVMPATATKAPAHWYPIFYIDECLNHGVDGADRIPASASKTGKFRHIVGICYEAAQARTADPERAIRAYIKTLDKGSKN